MPTALEDAKFVFIRRDARAPPLTSPYLGPFKVIKAGPKFFEVLIKNKVDKVSIDRLKRAVLEEELCYDSESEKSRSRAEISKRHPTQPLETKKKRGRPSREALAERERQRDEERLAEREREREKLPLYTRTGRISRPPDRL